MKKMMVKSALIACVTLLLLSILVEVTEAARTRPPRLPETSLARPAPPADSVAYPQECPCCKWGYSGPFFLCQMICCKI
ncbi:hypothetical protein MKW94_001233 [Papaver nudicaule]|uniref:Uncharacterized protein n=1 Tax=Papaver nudicaule TaxID=74823 RepID=A0AA41VLU2_PAPNU|nr:hypothetical protein [Papaver nudicaule]